MSRQSKQRRDSKRAAEAKARRRKAAGGGRRPRITQDDLTSFFGSSTVDVSVIRSESGRTYREGENIPFNDRIILERREGVPIEDAAAIAEEYQSAVARGDFPRESRVTVMDSTWQMD